LRSAKLRRIRLVKPKALVTSPPAAFCRPSTGAFPDPDGELDRSYAHGQPSIAEPVFGQAGFAAARAASAAAHPGWAPSTTGAEAMDVDDNYDSARVARPKPPGLDEPDDDPMLNPSGERGPDDGATSDDPWRGFQRAPRAFGHPGGVREVEPGGMLERLVEEWTIDDRPQGGAAPGPSGGRAMTDDGGSWLGRLATGWRGGAASLGASR
jgi:hypothetical protein